MDTAAVTPTRNTPASSGPVAAFVRFVVCGGGLGMASSAALVLLDGVIPFAVANAIVTVVSTLLATELHGRFTFRSAEPRGWACHLKSALSIAVCYLFTTGAMLILHSVQPAPGVLLEQAVYLGSSGLAGIGRFIVLRTVIFATGSGQGGARSVISRHSVAVAA